MMRANSPGAVMLSATLHAAAVAAALAGALWVSRGRDLPTRGGGFVLVPDSQLEFPGPNSGVTEAGPSTKPIGYHPSKVPRKPILAPVEDPAPEAKPEPSQGHGKLAMPNRPPVKPTPSTRPNRSATVARPAGPASTSAIPQIDGDALARDLLMQGNVSPGDKDNGPPGLGAAGPDSAELVRYFERLKVALQAAHEMPAGVDALFVSRVSFFLTADGALSAVRVLNPSGNPDYDRSVLEAFAKVRSIGAVPGGQSGVRTISFKMME